MEPGVGEREPAWRYMAAGLESGVLAVLVLLGWVGAASAWYRKSFWTSPNLMATTFYGDSALRDRFVFSTFSGLALYLLIYGLLGVLFGLAVGRRRDPLRIFCTAILVAIGWYYLSYGVLWKNWNPVLVLYTHDRPMFFGHVLYGALLGRYPRALRSIWPEKPAAAPVAVTAECGAAPAETAR